MFFMRMLVSGFESVVGKLKGYIDGVKQKIRESEARKDAMLNEAGEEIVKVYKILAPRSPGSGPHSADNIKFFVEKGWFTSKVVVDLRKSPLLFTITGTKPHLIFGSPLRWIDRRTGEKRFAMWVQHPGQRAQGWDAEARSRSRIVFELVLKKYGYR